MKILLFISASFLFLSCGDNLFKNEIFGETFIYKGEEFEHLQDVSMAFQNDTIVADVWFRTLNVDGDNKRLIRLYNGKDISVFSLNNSVNNYTYITFYAIKVGGKRLLWIEDNFGTTIFDIDKHKIIKTKFDTKKLTEIAPTGTPIGVKESLTPKKMLLILGNNRYNNFQILDSLSLRQ
jgi:hypothetical protein